MSKLIIQEQMHKNGIVAVVRGKDEIDAIKIAVEVIKGGIKTIEATFTTPNNLEVIRKLKATFKENKSILIGAGTVLDAITARLAILAGSDFIVSPSFDLETAKICNLYDVTYLPGCATPTEIVTAMQYGCNIIKIFPGGLLKSSFIKDIHGPIPHVKLMPSGGVSLDNIEDWVKNNAFAVSAGSSITKDIKTLGYDSVCTNSKEFVNKYNEALSKINK